MALHDKRLDVLINTHRNSQIETTVAFEDENKNFARTSDQTLTVSDTARTSPIEISQPSTTQNPAHKTVSNDNEKTDFRDFLNNRRLEELSEKIFLKLPQNKNTIRTTITDENIDQLYITTPSTNESANILQNLSTYRKDRTSTIERPTFLNVPKVDNMTTDLQINNYVGSLECNMTPNNNELDVQVSVTPNANDVFKKIVDCGENVNVNQENDLETPMSFFMDNLTSSVPTPNSQARNSEIFTEVSSTDVLNSPNTYMKSPAAVKEDSTFPDLFAAARAEPIFTSSITAAPLTVTDVEILDHTSLHAYLEKSIRIPLNVQSHLVNNAVIKYFLKENNLLLHLHSLRSYYFLLNGEFAKSLTDSLYARLYEVTKPIELFNSATLTNLLERALVNSFNNVYINSELLSFSATDTPTQLYVKFYFILSNFSFYVL